jgi:Uma2 family endonuclease
MSTTEARKTPPVPTASPIIGWDSAGIRMTVAEFDAIEDYDELYRYELVNGVLVVLPIPHEAQAAANEFLGYLVWCYKDQSHTSPKRERGNSEDPRSRFGLVNSIDVVTLSTRYIHLKDSRRLLDRVIWAGLGRRPNPREDVPTIAVEFVSQGRRNWIRDYETKRDEYLAVGVREYWIIDRFVRTMTVYSPGSDGFQMQVVTENETYQTPLLPGFELPLARLLAEADEWND